MKKKQRHKQQKQAKIIIKLLQSIDDKLSELIDGQARLEALMEPTQPVLKPEATRSIREAA